MYSDICLNGSVLATRSGITKATGALFLPSASSIFGYGFLSTHLMVRSSGALNSCSIALSMSPIWSRAAQRLRLATTSFASTFSPSWKVSPGRSLKVQVRPSEDTSSDSTIWRRGSSFSSTP